MANVLDGEVAEGRIVKECWDSRKAYYHQSQTENTNIKVASTGRHSSSFHLLEASEARDDSMTDNSMASSSAITLALLSNEKSVTSYLPQKNSDPGAPLGFSKLHDQEKPCLRKISSASDLGKTFSANNGEESDTAILQSKPEDDRSVYQDHKKMDRTNRHGSLPGGYIGRYLSVNSILKRVHSHITINDSESNLPVFVSKGRQPQVGERNCARRSHRSNKKKRSHSFSDGNSIEAIKEPKHFSESENSRENVINKRVLPSLMVGVQFNK